MERTGIEAVASDLQIRGISIELGQTRLISPHVGEADDRDTAFMRLDTLSATS